VVKSREGLLNEYVDSEPVTPEIDRKSYGFDDVPSPPDSPEAVLGRATSIELSRQPVRQVSSASKRSQVIKEGEE